MSEATRTHTSKLTLKSKIDSHSTKNDCVFFYSVSMRAC